jgi:hypothetical protein
MNISTPPTVYYLAVLSGQKPYATYSSCCIDSKTSSYEDLLRRTTKDRVFREHIASKSRSLLVDVENVGEPLLLCVRPTSLSFPPTAGHPLSNPHRHP